MEATFEEDRATPVILPWRPDDDPISKYKVSKDYDDEDYAEPMALPTKSKPTSGSEQAEAVRGSTDVIDAFNKKYGGSKSTKTSSKTTSSTKSSSNKSTKSTGSTATKSLRESIFGQDLPTTSTKTKPKATNSVKKKQALRKKDNARSTLLGKRTNGDSSL